MIGPRSGVKCGVRCGVAAGSSADEVGADAGGGMVGVTQDATSLIYVPATAGEWTTTMAVAGIGSGNPASLWLCQEASGNLSDTIDSNALTVAGANWTYRQAVTGWARLALKVTDASANHNAQNNATVPDVQTTSALLYGVVSMPAVAPGANRRIAHLNGTSLATIGFTTVPRLQCVTGGAGGSTVNGTQNPTAAVRPIIICVNRAANTAKVYSDQEKITGTQGTYTGVSIGWGSSGATTPAIGLLYSALWTGAAAEMSDAQIKTLLQTLGWTIPWT
jgi:hypothetical protein